MEEKLKISAFVIQALAALSIAFLTTLTGFIYAWPSYTLANFVSNETVLSAPMTTLEVSLLASLTNIGGLVVTPFCGYILDTIGRKYAAMLFGLPSVIVWTVISFSNYVPFVLAAVGFAGAGAAGQAVSSVYISEISQDSIRGALTSFTVSSFFFGLLISYGLGGYLSYYQVAYVHLLLSILYILMIAMLKESPVFLMQKGKEKEAAQSIAFYRRLEITSKEVEVEVRKIRLQIDPRINSILEVGSDITASKQLIDATPEDNSKRNSSAWKFLKESESSKRALATTLIIMSVTIMMGCIVLQVYAEPLFKEAVPSMNSNQCSIYLALDLMVASLICSLMLDKLGRKFLMTTTSIASGIFTMLLGLQLIFHWAPHWVTALFIYAYCFVYNLGAAVVPFVLTAELFLPEVRGLCNSITMACMWLMNFVTLIIFNPLVEIFGLGVIFCGFSFICFLGATFSQLCLPETKGLPADAIQLLFQKKRKSRPIV